MMWSKEEEFVWSCGCLQECSSVTMEYWRKLLKEALKVDIEELSKRP